MIRAAWRVAQLLLRVRQPVRPPSRRSGGTYTAVFDSGFWNVDVDKPELLIRALGALPDPSEIEHHNQPFHVVGAFWS